MDPLSDFDPELDKDTEPGLLLTIIRDQRVAFLVVGAINTAVGFLCFVAFHHLVGPRFGYMATLLCAHVVSVIIAFTLHRKLVFRVHGHLLRDLWRFETVNLASLGVNAVLLPICVELLHLDPVVAQLFIVIVTATVSWFGHSRFSFHRHEESS
ncbi:GtrA family protein [Arsenicicoccus piscis]|nr:GtrA family protein [Arsenicicoccus piscis]MCH8627712.1 GtrA family protein [Arsenicicoccus piscis]